MTATTDAAASAAIDAACRSLRLPDVREQAAELADQAKRSRATYLAYLAECLSTEVDARAERRRQRLIREAKFPRIKRLEDFDLSASAVSATEVAALAEGSFITKGEPVVLLGDSGTGKSHLLIGAGIAACETARRVRYVTAAGLVNELVEAEDDKALSRVVARYGRVDLLLIDEVGYLHLDPRGAELLFQVITEREERASIAAATNAPFSEWGQTFQDPRLAAAVVDRLTFNALIIETGSDSFRLRAGKKKGGKTRN